MGFKQEKQKQSANFRWQQQPVKYQLNLTSILGTSILKMYNQDGIVSLEADGKTYQDKDASHLIWRVSGWQIPVEQFPQWVKGQYKQQDKVMFNEQGSLSQLYPNCEGCGAWVINYSNYKLINSILLPHKIVFKNNHQNSQLLIRVNKWTTH